MTYLYSNLENPLKTSKNLISETIGLVWFSVFQI